MKRLIIIIVYSLLLTDSFSQTITQKLEKAYQQFENDEQLKHANSSLYIIDAATGKVVFEKNSMIGLAPASTQKIITAATAFELLGKEYRYKTEFGYKGQVEKNILDGFFYLIGSGDPTFGSWRYKTSTPDFIYNNIIGSVKRKGINNDSLHFTSLLLDLSRYSGTLQNDFWIWQDLANYYGIGSCALNWRENQFDVIAYPGSKEGEGVEKIKVSPYYVQRKLDVSNGLFTGKRGSGDNAYFYFSTGSNNNEYYLHLKGTIPAGVDSFIVSASHPDPPFYFTEFLLPYNIEYEEITDSRNFSLFGRTGYYWGGDSSHIPGLKGRSNILYTHYSPPLDSIIYWFLKKSINLYGEALVKTFAYEKKGYGATDTGVNIIKNFWKQKGIDPLELNLYDGSGLSPLNRVTTHAQVEVLKYAEKQNWFKYFYDALPEFNGMKMKSGTISDVKGFCGYQKAKDGKEYIFSFMVNNYNGMSLSLVNKMYKVLDILK